MVYYQLEHIIQFEMSDTDAEQIDTTIEQTAESFTEPGNKLHEY